MFTDISSKRLQSDVERVWVNDPCARMETCVWILKTHKQPGVVAHIHHPSAGHVEIDTASGAC